MSTNDDNEAIGYGRPPTKTRFQKGQSGNPRGRRKGSTNFSTDLKYTLQALVVVQDRGKPKKISTQRAMLMLAREKALKGDWRALDRLLGLANVSSVDANAGVANASEASDQAILEHYRERLRQEQLLPSRHDAKPSDAQGDTE